MLGPFFFMLAARGKLFALWHLNIGPIPLYISEIALISGWIIFRKNIAISLKNQNSWVIISWLAFCIWGLLCLFWSWQNPLEGQRPPVLWYLKDFALIYLALWLPIFWSFNQKQITSLLKWTLLGASGGQLYEWYNFLTIGSFSMSLINEIGGPTANDSVTPFFPIAMGLFGPWMSFAMASSLGHSILGQFLFYFKKTWMLTFLASIPIGLHLSQKNSPSPKSLSKIFIRLSGGICLGLALASLSAWFVSYRPALFPPRTTEIKDPGDKQHDGKFSRVLERAKDDITEMPKTFFFHGESDQGGAMAWRLYLWKQTWSAIKESPVFGIGFGNPTVRTQIWGAPAMGDSKQSWISGPHNILLSVWYRTGFLGAIALFVLVIASMVEIFFKNKIQSDRLFVSKLFMFGCTLVFGFFHLSLENPQNGIWFWMFLGFLSARE